MRIAPLLGLVSPLLIWASDAYPPPRFTDPQRVAKLESGYAEIDQLFERYASARHIPGMVWGIVVDGKLARLKWTGKDVNGDTVFRIASMTKSFTSLAVLKLRDEGKLSLEDPVSKWIPEFARMELPTRDSGPLRIRHFLSHGAGFPEDNPWGDQQLGATEAQMTEWLKKGLPFSTPPDTRYEYSNYGFGLLGRIVAKASGRRYEDYLEKEILKPLGMSSSTLEPSKVDKRRLATGYRRLPDGSYQEEAQLPHGAFGAMGGLLVSGEDLGRYVAFQLSAWPPRDDAEAGPVRRSSVREINHLWRPSNLTSTRQMTSVSGYGFGLRVSADCRFEHIVGHGGGLPGFGSYMSWLPDYGVGMFAMANLTYAGPSQPINQAWDVLLKTGGLKKRELPAVPALNEARDWIVGLWKSWDDMEAKRLAAMNLYLDVPVPFRRKQIDTLKAAVGNCTVVSDVTPENWLRGGFRMTCDKGTVGVSFTLAPTKPPGVQHLAFQKLSDDEQLSAPTGPPAGVSCRE